MVAESVKRRLPMKGDREFGAGLVKSMIYKKIDTCRFLACRSALME